MQSVSIWPISSKKALLTLFHSKAEIANVEHPGTLTLLVTRPKDNDFIVQTANFPSLGMTQESCYKVWVYPHGDDRPCKRLIDCAKEYLHGEPGERAEHIEKRISMQKFCSGLEHTAMPKPLGNPFDRSKLTAEQRLELEILEARCWPDQRAVLDNIFSCQSAVHMVKGPPGSEKTSFAAQILVPILNLFGLKANCYASSNAATDVFAKEVPSKLRPIRYHGLVKEKLGVNEYNQVEHRSNVPIYDAEAMSQDGLVWMTSLTAATTSRSWLTPGKMERPNFMSNALYIRAFQHARVMNADGVLARSLPATVHPEYMMWARSFYKLGTDKPDNKEGERMSRFKELTEKLFEDTLDAAEFVITTCSNAADKTLRKHTAPHVVIIDDAGVAKELETLMAMYHNLSSAWLFIILGNPYQHPIVPSFRHKLNKDEPNSRPYNIFATQLATSFMARQINNGIRHSTFTAR